MVLHHAHGMRPSTGFASQKQLWGAATTRLGASNASAPPHHSRRRPLLSTVPPVGCYSPREEARSSGDHISSTSTSFWLKSDQCVEYCTPVRLLWRVMLTRLALPQYRWPASLATFSVVVCRAGNLLQDLFPRQFDYYHIRLCCVMGLIIGS